MLDEIDKKNLRILILINIKIKKIYDDLRKLEEKFNVESA